MHFYIKTFLTVLLAGFTLFSFSQSEICSENPNQFIYIDGKKNPKESADLPVLSDKNLVFTDQGNKKIEVKKERIILVHDANPEKPVFSVFDEKGTILCSSDYGVFNFPEEYNYLAIDLDHNIIKAALDPNEEFSPDSTSRKLVDDNINLYPIKTLFKSYLVLECFTDDQGLTKTMIVHVSPTQLFSYKDDIIKMMNLTLNEFGTIPHNMNEEPEVSLFGNPGSEKDESNELEKEEEDPNQVEIDAALAALMDSNEEPTNLGKRKRPTSDVISEKEKEEIQAEAEDKLYQLNDAFIKLSSRDFSSDQKKRIRESTIEELFTGEDARVAVSSTNSNDIPKYLIGEYLLRLERILPSVYQEVKIEFANINKVSNFVKQPDGTWSAIIVFSQKFEGYKELDGSGPAYSDLTTKNVTVTIRRSEIFSGNSVPDVYWEVLLSDIGVNQTEPFRN